MTGVQTCALPIFAVHQKETELAAIVTEMTLTAVAAERSRLTEEAAARAQAERIRLTELSLPTETPGPAATEKPVRETARWRHN